MCVGSVCSAHVVVSGCGCVGVGPHTGHPGQHSGRGNTALSAQATAPDSDTALATTTHTPRPQQRAHTHSLRLHSTHRSRAPTVPQHTTHNTTLGAPSLRPDLRPRLGPCLLTYFYSITVYCSLPCTVITKDNEMHFIRALDAYYISYHCNGT